MHLDSEYRVRDLFNLSGCLSLSRVALAAIFPFTLHQPLLALGVIAVAGVSDLLDGYFARRLHQNTPTGAALDPVTDKIFATAVMVSLIAAGRLPLAWAALLSVRELLEIPLVVWLVYTPHARWVRTRQPKSNLLGKATTALQFGALCSLLFGQPYFTWWITATALLGLLSGLSYWASFRAGLQQTRVGVRLKS